MRIQQIKVNSSSAAGRAAGRRTLHARDAARILTVQVQTDEGIEGIGVTGSAANWCARSRQRSRILAS